MGKINFAALSPEEVQALTGKDLEAYNAWVLKNGNDGEPRSEAPKPAAGKEGEAVKKLSGKALGKDYFKRHPECPYPSIIVTSDDEVYPGTPHGKNAAENYVRSKKAANIEIELLEVERD